MARQATTDAADHASVTKTAASSRSKRERANAPAPAPAPAPGTMIKARKTTKGKGKAKKKAKRVANEESELGEEVNGSPTRKPSKRKGKGNAKEAKRTQTVTDDSIHDGDGLVEGRQAGRTDGQYPHLLPSAADQDDDGGGGGGHSKDKSMMRTTKAKRKGRKRKHSEEGEEVCQSDDLSISQNRPTKKAKHRGLGSGFAADQEGRRSQPEPLSPIPEPSYRPTGRIPIPDLNVGARDHKNRDRDHILLESKQSFVKNFEPSWPRKGYWHSQPILLGGGGFGQAVLYLHVDPNNGRVTDRVVVKTTWLPRWAAAHSSCWYGDVANPTRRKHMEIKVMQNIWRLPGSDKCVELRHSETSEDGLFYRLYLNYCPHGDLQSLIEPNDHLERRGARAEAEDGGYSPNYKPLSDKFHWRRPIPEPALWSFFDNLVEACLLLEYGGVEPEDARPGWERIVHRDMKLDNVFLDVPDESRWPSYPKAKLADFGSSIITWDSDPLNPLAYNNDDGTVGWKAQEQMQQLDRDSKLPLVGDKLTSKTNVWGIGAILIRLMNRDWDTSNWSGRGMFAFENSPHMPKIHDHAKKFYSKTLQELADWCVRYSPADRPGLRELRKRILVCTETGREHDVAKGMRECEHDGQDEYLALRYPKDEYRLILAKDKV